MRAEVEPVRSFRERRPAPVGAISIDLIALGVFMAFKVDDMKQILGVYTVYADLEDAAGLQPGNEVRVAGVKVGNVKEITLRPGAARIRMEIENDVLIPRESDLEVKLKTLLGQKFIDVQFPRAYLLASSAGRDASLATGGYLKDGDVIPRAQTRVPFEIYEAATEGTRTLEEIDKQALRHMLDVLAGTTAANQEQTRAALVALDEATGVLARKSPEISSLLRNTEELTGNLADSDQDIEGILIRSASVLKTVAQQRRSISSLLAATNHLSENLGLLIRAARGNLDVGLRDLNSILVLAEADLDEIGEFLEKLPRAQRMFAQPLMFGRFVEGHACAVTTEDTCVPAGSPEHPGVPFHGVQPTPTVTPDLP